MLTPSYIKSPFCLAEMGAAWALGQIIYLILVSPLKFSDLQGTPIQAKKCLNLFDKASLIKLGTTFLKDDKASAILELR